MKVMKKMYLHSDKASNSYLWTEEWELPEGKGERAFQHALYEVEFDVEVDTETGETEIKKVNGKSLVSEELCQG